jgi:protoporphyrinogen oxidase
VDKEITRVYSKMTDQKNNNKHMGDYIVLGGGLAGLSAGYTLSRAGHKTVLFEAYKEVGGLSRTIVDNGFRYDLGGHRFFTHKKDIEALVRELMGDELITVGRKSQIFMNGKFFDYPLKPLNSLLGLGPITILKAALDYTWQRMIAPFSKKELVSLEDWVVRHFGRTMFNLYFKEYSEKVWGIPCDKISRSWVEKRIQGLSFAVAVKNALFKITGKNVPTLIDDFLYPQLGIGRISDRLAEEININNSVYTSSAAVRVEHENSRIKSVTVQNGNDTSIVKGEHFLSTVPLTALIEMMDPPAPAPVREAAAALSYRDLLLVTVTVDKESVTNQSWVYIPQLSIPFGRIHEPKIWSSKMAPPGKTLVVVEYFCFKNDDVWLTSDAELGANTVRGLAELGFLEEDEVLDTGVMRIEKAYPLFDVGYDARCDVIYDYLKDFSNLSLAGRAGMFQYLNMDHAIESGIKAAQSAMDATGKQAS